VVRQFLERPIRVKQRVLHGGRTSQARLVVELLDDRHERRDSGPGSHEQDAVKTGGRLLEREIACDSIDVGDGGIPPRIHLEERGAQAAQRSVLVLFEDDVELEMSVVQGLERR
jgi:hypothetical protein